MSTEAVLCPPPMMGMKYEGQNAGGKRSNDADHAETAFRRAAASHFAPINHDAAVFFAEMRRKQAPLPHGEDGTAARRAVAVIGSGEGFNADVELFQRLLAAGPHCAMPSLLAWTVRAQFFPSTASAFALHVSKRL